MTTKSGFIAGLVLLLLAGSASAALISRAGGQAYYDTVLNITWLADANAGAGTIYDDSAGTGTMTWASAQAWIASLNSANYLGASNWRLPNVIDTGTSGCDSAYTGTDCGYNVDLTTGEMAHLFYSTLGNVGYYDTSGSPTGCSPSLPYCLTNTGPFSNIQPYAAYWSGTTYAPISSYAWVFFFGDGAQTYSGKDHPLRAWAVSSGDIAAVPVPAAAWLLGSALGVMGMIRRKVHSAVTISAPGTLLRPGFLFGASPHAHGGQ